MSLIQAILLNSDRPLRSMNAAQRCSQSLSRFFAPRELLASSYVVSVILSTADSCRYSS